VPEVYRETLRLASQERVVLKNCKTRKKEKEGGVAKMDAGTINFIFAVPEGMSRPSIPLFYKGFG
jgi:hypothetical protein